MSAITKTVPLSLLALAQCVSTNFLQTAHDDRHALPNSRENTIRSRLEDQFTSKFVWRPKHRTLLEMHDDINNPRLREDLQFVKHKMFGVSIPAYRHKDFISDTIKRDGAWDLEDVQKICDTFAENGGKGNILDVGANIGSYSLPLAACMKQYTSGDSQVISVEGYPLNAQHFRAGIKFNGLDNIRLYEYAVGAPLLLNQVAMKEFKSNEGMNRLKRAKLLGQRFATYISKLYGEVVPMTTIDAMMASDYKTFRNVFLMKIDIEGTEEAAFEGAQQFLRKGPCVIFIETKYNKNLVPILEGKGYVLKNVHGEDDNAWFERHDFEQCVAALE
jgi:FkbM family methyltransferase